MKSKLILGTAQLGLNYGINNSLGKPSIEQAFEILNLAFDNEVKILDTAEAYGNSQQVIGLFHKKYPKKQFNVITKLNASASFEKKTVINFIEEDIIVLNLPKLYGFMFHNYTSFKKNQVQYNLLINAKKQGLVDKIGTSLYTNKEFEDLLNNYNEIDIIQLPFNLLDNDLKRGNLLARAKQKGIEIHTRSAFLQGLFFKKTLELPNKLITLKKYLEYIKEIERKNMVSTDQLALQYPLSKPYIDYVLIGVENVSQLQKNITAIEKKISFNYSNIDKIDVKEEKLLNPVNW